MDENITLPQTASDKINEAETLLGDKFSKKLAEMSVQELGEYREKLTKIIMSLATFLRPNSPPAEPSAEIKSLRMHVDGYARLIVDIDRELKIRQEPRAQTELVDGRRVVQQLPNLN